MQTEKILAPTLSRPRHFNRDEQETWAEIMSTHRKKRKNQLHPISLTKSGSSWQLKNDPLAGKVQWNIITP